ncbi:hypothetical protein ILUMI_11383 [Ignelater luminosus]|uniref:Endonuclease/exonuclease/phosphatase domain-containing protein n=1 Tax=Ignelater luminosus TaxID=2038154 RepID=A0A8K0CWC1_IGNLU|nr:hypothetical protein ILUMI_11383 [Ignelater luminosus]
MSIQPKVPTQPRQSTSLQIAFWNANRLEVKKFDLLEFARHCDLDSILVCETHLRQPEPRHSCVCQNKHRPLSGPYTCSTPCRDHLHFCKYVQTRPLRLTAA